MKERVWRWTQAHSAFLRILFSYVLGVLLLLGIFSSVLSWLLTRRTTEEYINTSYDTITTTHSTANFILNDIYDAFYNQYQSHQMNTFIYANEHSIETQLAIKSFFSEAGFINACVESVYLINRSIDKIYTSTGHVTGYEDFYDQQALTLFEFYNERSSTVFLPRTTTYTVNGEEEEKQYITLIFARQDGMSEYTGGLVVNISQTALHQAISADVQHPEYIYIITDTGSIISSSDTSKINTSLQGTSVYKTISESGGKEFVFYDTFEGRSSLITCRKSDRLLFYFVHIVPTSDISAYVSYTGTLITGMFAVLLVVGVLLAVLISRRIYKPLFSLVTSMRGRLPAQDHPSLLQAKNEYEFLDSAYTTLYHQMENLAHAQQREFLIRLLRGEYGEEKRRQEQMDKTGLHFAHPRFVVTCVFFDDYAQMLKKHAGQDIALFKYAIQNVAEELLAPHVDVYSCENGIPYATLLLNYDLDGEVTPGWIDGVFHQLGGVIKEHFDFSVTVGIGTGVQDVAEVPASYNNALAAANYRLVLGQNTVIPYRKIALRQTLMADYPIEQEKNIILAIRNRNKQALAQELDLFFSKTALANVDHISMSCSQLLISLTRLMKSLLADEDVEQNYSYRRLSVQMKDLDCLDQRKALLLEYCERMIDSRAQEVQGKKSDLVNSICHFIQSNYANPELDVEHIAEFAELSSGYLRSIFKEVTGKSPSEYITEYRIAKARDLLEGTDYTTKQVATTVGYANHRYFYSVFKSHEGVTPTDYRKLNRQGGSI